MRRLSDIRSIEKIIKPIKKVKKLPLEITLPSELRSHVNRYIKTGMMFLTHNKIFEYDSCTYKHLVRKLLIKNFNDNSYILKPFTLLDTLIIENADHIDLNLLSDIKVRALTLTSIKKITFTDLDIRELSIESSKIDSSILKLKNLEVLNLTRTNFIPSKYFINTLKCFTSQYTNLSPETAHTIIKECNLLKAIIIETEFTIEYYNIYPNIPTLIFSGIFYSDLLMKNPDLEALYLNCLDSDIEIESSLSNLKILHMEDVKISCRSLNKLTEDAELRVLSIPNSNLNYMTIKNLIEKNKKTLKHINITKITLPIDFIPNLKKILKNCKVRYGEEDWEVNI